MGNLLFLALVVGALPLWGNESIFPKNCEDCLTLFTKEGSWRTNYNPKDPQTKVAPVFKDHDGGTSVAWLPPGAYIVDCEGFGDHRCSDKKESHMNPDGQELVHVEFAHIKAGGKCGAIYENKKNLSTLKTNFEESADWEWEARDERMRQTLMRMNEPSWCYVHGDGWVLKTDLKELPTKVPSKAPHAIPYMPEVKPCEDCEGPFVFRGKVVDLQTASTKVIDDINKRLRFQKAGKINQCHSKIEAKLPDNRLIASVNLEPVSFFRKNRTVSQECKISLEKGCGDPKISAMERAARLADSLYSQSPSYCSAALNEFYDRCDMWSDLNLEERFKKVRAIARKIVPALRAQNVSHPALTPALLMCVTSRENVKFEPSRVNLRACQERRKTPVGVPLPDGLMGKWKSNATGLSMHLFATVDGFWKHQLRDKRPALNNTQNLTFEERYGSSEKFFKAMSNDPEMQLEMMARHLKSNLDDASRHKGSNMKEIIKAATISYDGGEHSATYGCAILDCLDCLGSDANNFDCVFHLHDTRFNNCQKKGAK